MSHLMPAGTRPIGPLYTQMMLPLGVLNDPGSLAAPGSTTPSEASAATPSANTRRGMRPATPHRASCDRPIVRRSRSSRVMPETVWH